MNNPKDIQAFPVEFANGMVQEGMTLRDYFAGQALISVLRDKRAFENTDLASAWAYEFADNMLEERSNHAMPKM